MQVESKFYNDINIPEIKNRIMSFANNRSSVISHILRMKIEISSVETIAIQDLIDGTSENLETAKDILQQYSS